MPAHNGTSGGESLYSMCFKTLDRIKKPYASGFANIMRNTAVLSLFRVP